MNEKWIRASHESADNYKSKLSGIGETMYIIRVLDIVGLFETSWIVFDHIDSRFGYPLDEYEQFT